MAVIYCLLATDTTRVGAGAFKTEDTEECVLITILKLL